MLDKILKRRDKQFILNFASVVGVCLTMTSAIKDTTKACKLINDDMTTLEKIKKTWKCYIPSGVIATSTILCIIYSDKVSMNEKIALLNTLTTIQDNYKALRESIDDVCDEESKEEIIKKTIKNKVPKDVYIERTEEKLFFEEYIGDFFISTIDNVLKAEYLLNKQLYITGSASLNDFYKFLGLSKTDIGRQLGWGIYDECFDSDVVKPLVDFKHNKMEGDDGCEFYYLGYNNHPEVNYELL